MFGVVEIRQARPDDLPALAGTLAAAFAAYPWTQWTVDERDHSSRLRGLYAIYLEVALRFGQLWTADDRSGAAAWTWSADEAIGRFLHEQGLGLQVAELTGDRAAAAREAEELLAGRRPEAPHWSLAAIGVDPDRQGAGLGARLLRPVLDRCDAEGELAALETSSPDNVRFYERLGFVAYDEVALPDGPRVWLMRRAPKPQGT